MCVFIVAFVLCRGQISRDYEQEFLSVQVGPRLLRQYSDDSQTTLLREVSEVKVHFPFRKKCQFLKRIAFFKENVSYIVNVLLLQDVDSEDYWEKLAKKSDPSRQQRELINHNTIILQVQSKILTFKAQVRRCSF